MLFSDPQVSRFVRENFVAAWESLRPVPVVEIDFGGGRKIKRTVNGNIAFTVCAPDGRVVDIIPGLNRPHVFLADLRQALALHRRAAPDFEGTVLAHHRARKDGLPEAPPARMADRGKMMIELPLKSVLPPDEEAALDADTRLNRLERKPLIHAILAERIVKPADVTRRLYKEVLHCDLDDPYLGLAPGAFKGGAYDHP